jgi:signal transduction histidine kinase
LFEYIKNRPYLLNEADIDTDAFLGILDENELSNYHTNIGAELKHATTLYVLRPNNNWFRIDSKILEDKMRGTCNVFRKYFSNLPCYKSDYDHANLFANLLFNDLRDEAIQNKYNIKCFTHSENNYLKRYYTEYKCTFLQHIEYVFPIVVNDFVVAVMFIGQFGELNNAHLELKKYLDTNPNFFKENKSSSAEKLCLDCKNNYKKVVGQIISEMQQSEYKIAKSGNDGSAVTIPENHIIRLLSDFEGALNLRYLENAKSKIRLTFNNFKDKVFSDLELINDIESADSKLDHFWEIIKKQTCDLFLDLELTELFVFGNEEYSEVIDNSEITYLPQIFSVSSNSEEMAVSFFKGCIQISNNQFNKKYPSLLSLEEINFGLSATINDLDKTHVFVWPSYDNSCCIIFELKFMNESCYPLELRETIFDNLLNLYASIFSIYQSIWALISKEKVLQQKKINEDTFSIFSHEISQHTTALSLLYLNNLCDLEHLQNLNDEKYKKVSSDFYSSVEMLDYLAKNSKIYLGVIKPEPTKFWAFGEKIFKFKEIFRTEAEKKAIEMKTPGNLNRLDKYRSELRTDKVLFEQILFNILRNAFQYSHPCTNIVIDCKKDIVDENAPHKLIVTNIGIKLDDNVDVFAMHTRGIEASRDYVKGTGIGLFIVKTIVDALKGSVTSISTPVSESYNLPLLKQYIAKTKTETGSVKSLNPEIIEIAKSHNFYQNQYFNADSWEEHMNLHELDYFEDRINQATWETTFVVEIPVCTVK